MKSFDWLLVALLIGLLLFGEGGVTGGTPPFTCPSGKPVQVVVIYQAEQRDSGGYSNDQVNFMEATDSNSVFAYLTGKGANPPLVMDYDSTKNTEGLADWQKQALEAGIKASDNGKNLPWLLIATPTSGTSMKLPETLSDSDAVALVKKYGG